MIRLKSCISPESSEMIPFPFRSRKGDELGHSLQVHKRQAQGCKPAKQTSADSSPLITHLQLGRHQRRRRVTSPTAPPAGSGRCGPHTARYRCGPLIVLHAIGLLSWPVLLATFFSKSQDSRRNIPILGPKSQGFPNRILRYIPIFHKDTKKNNNDHLAAIQVQVWNSIYNINAARRKV